MTVSYLRSLEAGELAFAPVGVSAQVDPISVTLIKLLMDKLQSF